MSGLLILALVVACPLLMMFMMRGGHGHGSEADMSANDLHVQRDKFDHLIAEREEVEGASTASDDTPVGYRGGVLAKEVGDE